MGNFYAKIYCGLSPALKALNSQAKFDSKSYEEDLLANVGNPSSRLFTKSFSDFLTTSALPDLTCDIKCQLTFF